MLVIVPRFYEPLEQHAAAHAGLHVAIALLGLATGLGATRLGRVGGRLAVFLSVGMMLMFAAAMTGG
jgi:Flp pilus assembly protein protease CpaA